MSGAHVVRAGTAPAYSPPGHVGVQAVRLQGQEAGGPEGFWVGRSEYPPGAYADLAQTAGDTVYVALAGSLRLEVTGEAATRLAEGDSVFLPAGTERSVRNDTEDSTTLLVVVQPAGRVTGDARG